ncbi:MAG TPA: alpha/beta hydrolase [Caulobacteraceae bacterium]|nr:alpha/beta hydrolase [Caulobacteraceae bacterium]
MPLDRGAQRLLRMLAAAGHGAGVSRTAAERRRTLENLAEMVEATPHGALAVSDLAIGEIGARLYTPDTAGGGLVVYFHGGGWVAGSLTTHDGVCRRLALASGHNLLAVDYRLAPEHPFPAACKDALTAVRWAAEQADALDFDPARLAVAGDSAGAGLAAVVVQTQDRPPLALQLLICPILDVSRESVSRRDFAEGYFLDQATLAADLADYCASRDLSDPQLSPLLAESLTNQPPALIHTAEFDPFRDEGEAYAKRLTEAGCDVRHTRHNGMIHYFYAMPRAIPHAETALAAIGAEIAALL